MNLNQETKTKNVWYFKNQEPVIQAKRRGEAQNFYGALNVKTGRQIAITADRQNSQWTIKFLKTLAKFYRNRKIFLIWDGAGWHKSKAIRRFLKSTKQFELFNFPPYSPELNPEEQVWKALRQNITHNRLVKNFSVLTNECLIFLNNFRFDSIKFKSLFG